jgi:hypothetical protein
MIFQRFGGKNRKRKIKTAVAVAKPWLLYQNRRPKPL